MSFQKLFMLAALAVFLLPTSAFAATYYVSNSGSDSNSGTSPSTPWQTINKVNNSTFSPGDSVLFNRGDTWHEQLTIPSSGATSSPITFGSYGSGNLPLITEAATLSGSWTEEPVAAADTETYESGTISSYWDTVAGVSDSSIYKNGSKSWRYATTTGNLITKRSGGTNTNYAEIVTWFRLDSGSTAAAWDQTEIMRMEGSAWNGSSDVGVWIDKSGDGTHYEMSLGQGNPSGTNGSRFTINTDTWYELRFVVTADNGAGNAHAELYAITSGSSWGSPVDSLTGLTLGSAINNDLEMGTFISQPTSFEVNFDDTSVYTTDSTAASNVWSTATTSDPWILTINGNFGVPKLSEADLANEYDFATTTSNIYLYSTTDPASSTIQYAARGEAIYADGKSNITVKDLEVQFGGWENILFQDSAGNDTVEGVTSKYSYRDGVNFQYANHAGVTDGVTVENNTISDVLSGGVNIAQAKNVTVSGNDISAFAIDNSIDYANGVQIGDDITHGREMTNILVEKNLIYDGGYIHGRQVSSGYHGEGIHLDTVGTGSAVRYNLVHNCSAGETAGVHVEVGEDTAVYGNVVYGCSFGILLSTWGSNVQSGNLVYNNTAYNNGIGIQINGSSPETAGGTIDNTISNNISTGNTNNNFAAILGGENDGTYGSGNVYTYNNFGPASSNFIEWGNGSYLSSYSAFDTAYGTSTHSVSGDPKFTNTSTDDLTLESSSPAIDAGVNLGTTYENGLDPSSTWPSNVSTLNQNNYGSAWDLGAFVYHDSTAPTVSITSPQSGSVSGTVNITASASASSPAAISSVTFTVDGATIATDTAAPYSTTWDSSSASNGSHTITATATDNYGNTSSASVTVTISRGGGTMVFGSSPLAPGYQVTPQEAQSGRVHQFIPGTPATPSTPTTTTSTTQPSSSLSTTQIQAILSLLTSFGADQSVIMNVSAALTGHATTQSTTSSATFTRDLHLGSRGSDVKALQQYLNSHGFQLANFGPGAPGEETDFFGDATRYQLSRFQKAHGITPAAGYFGPITKAAIHG